MSEEHPQKDDQEIHSDGLQPERVSRRQFLTYTIASVGGFLVSGTLFPMVRMAIDPVFKHGEAGDFIEVGSVEDFGPTPKSVKFNLPITDGWYDTEQTQQAFVTRDENGDILALSSICKHLGCTVNWEGGGNENRYFCPCHFGLYYKNGLNVPNTPPPEPLDKYEVEIRDGKVYLGPLQPNPVNQPPKGE